MQNVSSSYLLEIKKPSRSFECKVTIGDNIYTNSEIVNITIEDVQPSDGFYIGSTVSKLLEITLSTNNIIYSNSVVKVEMGLNIGSTIEYVLIGYFNIDDVIKTDYSIKLTCYDNMMKFEKSYFSNLGNTSSLKDIVNELSQITGVEFTGSLPSYTLNKLEGFTCRDVLGFVASICGGNAYITRDGKFTIKTPIAIDYSITDDNYIDLKSEEDLYKVGAITCKSDDKEITKGTVSNSTMEIAFENPWVNESILTDIYNKLKDFEFIGYSMKWQGDFSLDVGDIISITDTKGFTRQVPILYQKLNYNGGLTSEIGAKGESKNKNEFNSTGNLNNKVNRVVTDLLLVNKALINKADIEDLKAVNADMKNLIAENVTITGNLNAVEGEFGTLKANVGVIDKLTVTHTAQINELEANKASIVQLEAVSANIGTLEAEVGKIQTLVNGNLTSENIQSLHLTSASVTVENGFIKSAMIESLDVSKVNAGDISTNKFKIRSDNGGIEIVGATQQFKDKNNKVRIQMGQDTQGNFNFIIRGEDGTTTLIDHTGIKEKAIADDLIKNNMIAQDAVGEKQINYSSFITGFNKDTNTSTIKSTKIMLDNQNQTLDIAFSQLKTQADGTKTLTESHSTTIGVMQGQITTAIDNTKIVKDGQTILLKDDYNRTVQTIDSMNSLIGSHTTQISGLNSTVSTQGSSISQLKNQIALKVEQTDITTAINNVQIGVRNYILNTDTYLESTTPKSIQVGGLSDWNALQGKKVVLSLDIEVEGMTPTSSGSNRAGYEMCVIFTDNTILYLGVWHYMSYGNFKGRTTWTYDFPNKQISSVNYSGLYIQCNATKCKIGRPKLEIGTKPTDYTSSPEDVQDSINSKANSSDVYTKTEVYTKSQTDSAIKIAKDEINLSISSTYETKTNVTTKFNNAVTSARTIPDTRNANENPQWYMTNYPNQTITEFKYASVVGLSNVGTYGTVTTTVPWSNSSGGLPVQVFRNNSTGATYERRATSTTAWGSWYQVEDTQGSQSKANSALSDAKSYTNGQITTVNQTISTKVAEIKATTDSITQRVSSTESKVTTIQSQVNTANSNIDKTTELAKAMSLGKMLYTDPIFKNGSNSVRAYNNSGGSDLTISRITKPSDLPTTSTHCIEIKVVGTTTSPWRGGFYFGNLSRSNAIFITRFIAKIPTGYTVNFATNAIGSGYSGKWLTSNIGTGKWEEYIYKIQCGSTGTFSTTNYFYLRGGSTPSSTNPLIWYLAYATVFDITDMDYTVQDHTTKITTTNNKVSTIETNLNSITSRVSSVEQTQTTVNGTLTSLQSRMSSAEQKITSDAIVSTVTSSQVYKDNLSEKVSSYEIISKINQTPEGVFIEASRLELTGVSRNLCSLIPGESFTAHKSTAEWNSTSWEWKISGDYIPLTQQYIPNTLTYNDTIVIDFECYATSNMTLTPKIYLYDNTKKNIGSYTDSIINITSEWGKYTSKIKLNTNIGKATYVFIGFIKSDNSKIVHIRNAFVKKAIGSELIVDGSIKAKHISTSESMAIFNKNGLAELTPTALNFKKSNGSRYMSMENGRFNLFTGGTYLGSLVDTSNTAYTTYKGVSLFGGYPCYYMDFGVDYNCKNPTDKFSYNPLMRLVFYQMPNAYSNDLDKTVLGRKGVHFYNEPVSYHTDAYMNGYHIYTHYKRWDAMWANNDGTYLGSQNRLMFGLMSGNPATSTNKVLLEITPAKLSNSIGSIASTDGIDAYAWLDMHGYDIWNTQIKISSDINLKQEIRYLKDNTNRNISEITELSIYDSFKNDINFTEYKYIQEVKSKRGDAKVKVGFLANDLEDTIIGNIILEKDKSTDFYSYDQSNYVNCIAVALQQEIIKRDEENQELREEIKELKKEIQDLKTA